MVNSPTGWHRGQQRPQSTPSKPEIKLQNTSPNPRSCTPEFCPKRRILVGLVKFLAVGCGLNDALFFQPLMNTHQRSGLGFMSVYECASAVRRLANGKTLPPIHCQLSIIHYQYTPSNRLFYGLRTQTPDPVLTRYVQCLRFQRLPIQYR